jgi:hypothetical protein
MARQTGHQGFRRAGTIQEVELKICDLCGSLNLAADHECFVCGWTGHFECEREIVRAAVEAAMRRHGRIDIQTRSGVEAYCAQPPSVAARFAAWIDSMWAWLSG